MPQMSPEEMAQMQQQAGKSNDTPVSAIAQQVGQGISQLAQAINGSDASSDQDRQLISQIMQLYAQLMDGLQQEAGEKPQQPEDQANGPVPMEAGMTGQPMGPETRQ